LVVGVQSRGGELSADDLFFGLTFGCETHDQQPDDEHRESNQGRDKKPTHGQSLLRMITPLTPVVKLIPTLHAITETSVSLFESFTSVDFSSGILCPNGVVSLDRA
jgi:hypothetical protein